MNTYAMRDATLQRLGYSSYPEYLASPQWRNIRARALKRDNYRCVKCLRPATEVHHTKYDHQTLVGQKINGLASVCRDCHQDAEVVNGRKTRIVVANDRLGLPGMLDCLNCHGRFPWSEFVRACDTKHGRNQPLFAKCKRCRKNKRGAQPHHAHRPPLSHG